METKNENSKKTITLDKYLAKQREIILSPENTWYAGERFGHEPNENEAVMHYIECGAAEKFAQEHIVQTNESAPK